jgi:xylose isomerase
MKEVNFMKLKLSVFLGNAGSCSDRFCSAYGRPYSITELFDRVASVNGITGIDLVGTPDFFENLDEVKAGIKSTGLKVVTIVPDLFTQAKFKQGSYSSTEPAVRSDAIAHTKRVIDIAVELGCDMVAPWPGQDGYDYLFQADYIKERTLFADAIKELCAHNKNIRIGLEYKPKEPRNRCYASTAAITLLMAQETGAANCGVVLDYGHALYAYENPAEVVALLYKYGDRLLHIHINDNYRYWDDDMITGSVHTLEYLEFFYWLSRTNYSGWITIDQFPYREDGRDAVAESAAWLIKFHEIVENADSAEIEVVLKKKDAVLSSKLMRRLLFG